MKNKGMMNKKTYIRPVAEIHRVEVEAMLALSIIGGTDADKEGEVLSSEERNWNIWAD